LPAVMVDPHRHEHEQRRECERRQRDADPPQPRRNQPPDQQRDADHRHPQRQHRRNGAGDPFGGRAIGKAARDQVDRGNRQIDQPTPVHVEPNGRIELILVQIIPALTIEQRADLRHAHIVVGVGQVEPADHRPALLNHDSGGDRPDQRDQREPALRDEVGNPLPAGIDAACVLDHLLAPLPLSTAMRIIFTGDAA